VEHIAHFFFAFVDRFGYPGLFGVMVLANIGIPVGAEVVVPLSGAMAATGHLSSVWLAGSVALAGELVGNCILYAVGFSGGRPFVVRYGKFVKLDESKLDAFHGWLDRYGSVVIFVCRFVPFVRGIAGLPAGVARMPLSHFLAYTAAGSACFCLGLAYLGFVFGHHLDAILPTVHRFSFALLVALVLGAAGFVVFQFRRRSLPS